MSILSSSFKKPAVSFQCHCNFIGHGVLGDFTKLTKKFSTGAWHDGARLETSAYIKLPLNCCVFEPLNWNLKENCQHSCLFWTLCLALHIHWQHVCQLPRFWLFHEFHIYCVDYNIEPVLSCLLSYYKSCRCRN